MANFNPVPRNQFPQKTCLYQKRGKSQMKLALCIQLNEILINARSRIQIKGPSQRILRKIIRDLHVWYLYPYQKQRRDKTIETNGRSALDNWYRRTAARRGTKDHHRRGERPTLKGVRATRHWLSSTPHHCCISFVRVPCRKPARTANTPWTRTRDDNDEPSLRRNLGRLVSTFRRPWIVSVWSN